jgi:PAS domain S-box-containing protein
MRRLPARYGEVAILAVVTVAVLVLGGIIARDVREFDGNARRLYDRLAQGLDLIDGLQYETQEVRRTLLYALHTSDANRQLAYAEQSRAAEARVARLLQDPNELAWAPGTRAQLQGFEQAWQRYLLVRDEVIGLILERSLSEGVALDEVKGTERFREVRQGMATLKHSFEADAAAQVEAAKIRANQAMLRLALLVASAVLAVGLAISLVRRRAALEAVVGIEAHKGAILQAVPDPIISADAEGRIIELNTAAEHAFGVTRSEALGSAMIDVLMDGQRRGDLDRLFSAGAAATDALPRLETEGVGRGGRRFPMELAAVSHAVGRSRIWTVHVSDLTAHRQAEQELRAAKTAAESATEAKSEFLATMSHELRTPLLGVVGIAELLRGEELMAPQRELLRMLRSSATSLLSLVSDILDYSRIEAGLTDLIPVPFSPRQSVEDALDTVTEVAARKGLDIGYLVEPGVPALVVADQDRVRQVLCNLLSNAVKFTDAGEVTVQVSASRGEADAWSITMAVTDTGCGIPAHLQQKLFRRFTQLDATPTRRHGGAGLGLTIAERLSRLLDGTLSVASAAGKGSTFTFVFTAMGQSAADPLDGTLQGVRVLLLRGGGIVGRQVESLLRRWAADVCECDPAAPVPPAAGRPDAIVMEADALPAPVDTIVNRCVAAGLAGIPVIVVTKWRAVVRASSGPDRIPLGTPVRADTLYEALCTACGRVPAVTARRDERPVFAPGALHVLLVEDNDANRRIVRLMLEELGAAVDDVSNGYDAVARARSHRYDVILMDVRMPGLDGWAATRRIRAEQTEPAPVIIAVTANVLQGEEARCRAAGMDGYLPKPLRLETLAAVLSPLSSRNA